MSITRETLLAALRPVIVAETVAPFGDIRIRQLPVTEVEDLREASNKDNKQFCHRLLIASVAGDDDRPLLTPADLPAVEAGSFGSVDALIGAVLRANGMGQTAEATAKN